MTARKKKWFVICIFVSCVLVLWINTLNSDEFNEDMALKNALMMVLKSAPYKGICEREHFYIQLLVGRFDSPTYDFDFIPKKGYEEQCPAVPVSVNRDTGEVWLLRM